MIPDSARLSIAFIESKPQSAARTLESLNPEDAAALIEALPARSVAIAFGEMSPWSAARCLDVISAERSAGIIQKMMFQDAAALMRMVTDTCRNGIYEALPSSTARSFQRSLAFPLKTVGANMDKLAPLMALDRTVSDAIKYGRQNKRLVGDQLFVTDGNHEFVGVVRISELLRHDRKSTLEKIVDTSIEPLLARSTLSAVELDPQWESHSLLPVVGRKRNFLVTLSRRVLVAASRQLAIEPEAYVENVLLPHMINGYAVTIYGLVKMLLQTGIKTPQPETQNDR